MNLFYILGSSGKGIYKANSVLGMEHFENVGKSIIEVKFMDDKEMEDMIMEMLENLYEDVENFLDKESEKLWRYDIKTPLSFKDALNRLTKDELTRIRQNLNLKGLSTLNKGELVDSLIDLIPTNMKQILYTFDQDRYSILKRIVAKGGYIKADDIDYMKLNFFRYNGLGFTGLIDDDEVIAMPVETMEIFKDNDNFEYKKIVDRNTLWISLIKGMLFYYGVMDIEDIVKKLEEHTKEKCDLIDVLNVIFKATEYYYQIENTYFGFKDFRVIDETWVIEEQRLKEDIPYYDFTKKELLRAGKDNYIEKTSQTNDFSSYLKSNYDIENEEIDEVLMAMSSIINNDGSIGDVIEMLQESFEMDTMEQMQIMSELVVNIHNNTRIWMLKGYKPDEYANLDKNIMEDQPSVIDIRTRKKIGRNDPCPCGSGKKHKNCCGR